MVSDKTSTTVDEYLEALDPARRPAIEAIRKLVADNLPAGYQETMAWGMPSYVVPLERYPDTYNGQPLGYVSFAAQKARNSIYLMGLYSDTDEDRSFRERWAGGKKLDMGKSCVRFKALEDLDLPLIGETIASMPVDRFLDTYERNQKR